MHSLLKRVDSLCTGSAWTCEQINVDGDMKSDDGSLKRETLELWRRDPVECVEELIGNPVWRDAMAYSPEHAYTDARGRNQIYDEMWTGDWWWETQVSTHHRL